MLQEREDFHAAVAAAREPAGERRKWFGRALLALLVAGIGWLMINRVLTPSDQVQQAPTESVLPGPV